MKGQEEAKSSTPDDSAGNSESATEQTSTEQTDEKSSGATSETATFKDSNMEKQFTEKMQELAEDRKAFEKEKQKAEAFDALMNDEESSKFITGWHDRKTGKAKEELTEISDEEYNNAITDKSEFQKIIDNRVKAVAKNEYGSKVSQLENQIQSIRLEQDIDDFTNAKAKDGASLHADFWELDKAGKIEPYLIALRNSGMSGIQIVEAAYKLAKYPNLKAEALKEAHTTITEKKSAIGEKGGKGESLPDTKKLSLMDFARRKAKELKMDVP